MSGGGDFVYLAPGSKVNNNVCIASYVILGSNAVLTRNAKVPDATYAGVPAKMISNKGWHPAVENRSKVSVSNERMHQI